MTATETKVTYPECPECQSADTGEGDQGFPYHCEACGIFFGDEATDGATDEQLMPDPIAKELFQITRDVGKLDREIYTDKLHLKGLNATRDEKVKRVFELLTQAEGGIGPLFKNPEDEDTPGEDWRTIPLAELKEPGLKPGTLAKLDKADIETVGDVADWESSSGMDLTGIEGIGPAAVQEINDALMALWQRRDMLDPRLPAEDDGDTEPTKDDASEAA